jgi:hypothetical protein
MDKMRVCRFYGWTVSYVDSMKYSDYAVALKCSFMLSAREGIAEVNYSSFSSFDDRTRESISRKLRDASDQYIWRPLLDYKTVAANLARKLAGGRR